MAAEREDTFWLQKEFDLKSFENLLKNENKKDDSIDYSMRGELSQRIEKNIGSRITLVRPIIDGYWNEIGKAIQAKLTRGNLTGSSNYKFHTVPDNEIYV